MLCVAIHDMTSQVLQVNLWVLSHIKSHCKIRNIFFVRLTVCTDETSRNGFDKGIKEMCCDVLGNVFLF